MSFTFKSLFMETITSPSEAAQKIIDIGVSRQTSILSIVFTVCITVILFFLDLSSSENSNAKLLQQNRKICLKNLRIGDARIGHVRLGSIRAVKTWSCACATTDSFVILKLFITKRKIIHRTLRTRLHSQCTKQTIYYFL